MITLTAIIKAKAGHEEAVHQALLQSATNGAAAEPGTIGYHVGRSTDDPSTFATFERFVDQAAMDLHNATTGKQFFSTVGDLLDGPPVVAICDEVWAK